VTRDAPAADASASRSDVCAVCGSHASDLLDATDYITGEPFVVRRCHACGFGITQNVTTTLDSYYPRRYRRYRGLTRATLKALYAWKARRWSAGHPPGLALDVGCGEAWMLDALRRRGWTVIGCERSLESARAAVMANDVPMFVGELDAIRAEPRVRLLIFFQVLEHLRDFRTALRHAAETLAPSGAVVVAVPNLASWQARLFGRFWFHLDVPRHVNHFSVRSLTIAFEQAGLRVERTRFVSFEHDPFGWIQSTLNVLGFRQNLLTKWLMGMDDDAATPATIAAMIAISLLLAVPSIMASLLSWACGAGALIEVWGVSGSATH